MTIFVPQFNICSQKLGGMTALFTPNWLHSWQQWLMAMWFWSLCRLQTRRQLTLATKRQFWHSKRNLQPTAKSVVYLLEIIPLKSHKFEHNSNLAIFIIAIDYESRRLSTPVPTSVKQFRNYFFITWTGTIADLFFLHISSPMSKYVKRW